MSPRAADDQMRTELIETAARLLAREGPDSLTTRRLAAEVGASTMVVYTHFDGMEDLRRAVRLEWFRRLAEHLSRVRATSDPIADLAAIGWAYFFSAIENGHMFRITVVDPLPDEEVAAEGMRAFGVLAEAVRRCIDAGVLPPGDADTMAFRIWMSGNGVIAAHLAGFAPADQALGHFYEMALSLLAACGADHESTRRSLERGRRRMQRRMTR